MRWPETSKGHLGFARVALGPLVEKTSYTKAPGGRSLLPMASWGTSDMRRTHVDSPPSLARREAPNRAIAFGNEYAHQRSAETALRVAVCAELVNMAWCFAVVLG